MERGSAKSLNLAVAAALAAGAAGTAAVMGARTLRAGTLWAGPLRAGTGARPAEEDPHPDPQKAAIGAEYAQPAADILSDLIRFQTVYSRNRDEIELDEFTGFIDALARLYPGVHAALELEYVNGQALLYKWPAKQAAAVDQEAGGSREAGAAQGGAGSPKPVVLMAHYDVVPVDPRDGWTHPGFSGHQDGTYVWGRGALDDKGALVVILSAVESLLQEGFAPSQDVYLSFGNNEETAGDSAVAAAALLKDRGVRPWLVLDEGGAVAENAFPGLAQPAAVVGVAEKGLLDVELLTRSPGGHASTPPKMGATARLAKAIMALEENPFPQSMPEPIVEMLRRIGAHSGFGLRLVTSNMWAFKPLLTRVFDVLGDETRAMTRTTVAITELSGSKGANVLAATAMANANIRIAVGETVEGTLERLGRTINDPSVQLTVRGAHNPSPISASDNAQFALITAGVAASYPQAVVTPYVQTGATDSRNFTGICPAVYRFSPLLMDSADRASLHAVDEKVRIASLGAGVVFYRKLLRSLP